MESEEGKIKRKEWSTDDLVALHRAVKAGFSPKVIASRLNRSEAAVRAKIKAQRLDVAQ